MQIHTLGTVRKRLYYLLSIIRIFFSVFVRKGKDGGAELVLLDHGLYDCLKEKDRINLCRLYKAIVNKDEKGMQHFSLQLGVKGKISVKLHNLKLFESNKIVMWQWCK